MSGDHLLRGWSTPATVFPAFRPEVFRPRLSSPREPALSHCSLLDLALQRRRSKRKNIHPYLILASDFFYFRRSWIFLFEPTIFLLTRISCLDYLKYSISRDHDATSLVVARGR